MSKQAYQEKLEAQLAEWDAKLDLIKAKAKNWLFGNCRENETGFNTPPNIFNDLAGQARGFCSRFHGNSQRAELLWEFRPRMATSLC
jgi:hypothetical protein